jgi:hypothetical protein
MRMPSATTWLNISATLSGGAQQTLATRSWETEGVQLLPGGLLAGNEIPSQTRALLERTNNRLYATKRGERPRSLAVR